MKKLLTLVLAVGVVMLAGNGLAQIKDPSQIGVRTVPVRPFVPLGTSPWCASVPQPIVFDENNPVSLNITIPDTFNITDLDVDIDITHTFQGDIDVNVTSPVVGPIAVLTGECGGNDDFMVVLDTDGADLVCASPTIGVGKDDDLGDAAAAFDGTAANGVWTVDFTDNFGGDGGFVNGVCLITVPVPVELKAFEVE